MKRETYCTKTCLKTKRHFCEIAVMSDKSDDCRKPRRDIKIIIYTCIFLIDIYIICQIKFVKLYVLPEN